MRLHLDRDRDEPFLWEETVRLDPAELGQDLLLELGPIEVRGRVELLDPEFQVEMDLRYEQALACTRCLAPARSEVSTHAELQVVTRPVDRRSPPPEPEVELDRAELGVITAIGEHIETEPLIAEQVLLEVPMKPLCGADCKGLCPRCGADRNVTPDCCEEPPVEERWEALGALRDRLSAEGR
ncbi:MAG TPA: DUF177 domain-containing protein [Thermoanaerobaculia bacterium]|nr:DUF177 domain-containing protein [Thermoanaerobaculia bacterium]